MKLNKTVVNASGVWNVALGVSILNTALIRPAIPWLVVFQCAFGMLLIALGAIVIGEWMSSIEAKGKR